MEASGAFTLLGTIEKFRDLVLVVKSSLKVDCVKDWLLASVVSLAYFNIQAPININFLKTIPF